MTLYPKLTKEEQITPKSVTMPALLYNNNQVLRLSQIKQDFDAHLSY